LIRIIFLFHIVYYFNTMVKNKFGGSKAKGYARKNENVTSNRLRMVQDEAEKYGIVRKLFGGCICEVYCDDRVTRHGVIRGKFRGKGKRSNIITSGTVVLVGLRDWASESKSDKCEQADILEVYSAMELDQLKQKPSFPIDFLENSMRDIFGAAAVGDRSDGFDFSVVEQDTPQNIINIDEPLMEAEQEINIDDI
jgi:initiation factor 1A